jgi:hypothetical protein
MATSTAVNFDPRTVLCLHSCLWTGLGHVFIQYANCKSNAESFHRSNKLEMILNSEALRTGTMIMFDMNGWFSLINVILHFLNLLPADIKSTTIVLTIVASLLALSSLIFSISLSYDWICHLLRPESTMSQEKMDSFGDKLTIQYPPFSTRTLGLQTIVFSFLSVWIFAVLIPSTLFSRTRSAHITITRLEFDAFIEISTKYWDYGFCECAPLNNF